MARKRLDNKPMSVRLSPTTREYLLEVAIARGLTVTAVLRDALALGASVMAAGQAGNEAVNHG